MIVNLRKIVIERETRLNQRVNNSISSIHSKILINRRDSCFSKRERDCKKPVSMLRGSILIKKTEMTTLLSYLDQTNFGLSLQIICWGNLRLTISYQHSFLSVQVAILK